MRSLPLALGAILTLNVICVHADPPIARAVAANSQTTPAADSSNLVLRPNDVFELRLSGMPADDASQFSGRIQAAGRTAGDIERTIEKALVEKKIFRWPQATLTVALQTRFVTIGGNVRAPNRPPWSADLTVLSAIMAAGGPSDFGGDKIHLIRGGKVNVYSYKKLRRDPSQDPKLLPGDTVELY
jgi:hypothetical protein